MATVSIPTPLRAHTEGQASVEASGSTVGEVLKALGAQYPEIQRRIFAAEGQLQQYVNVYVNDEDIRFMEELETPVKDQDEVSIIPAIAGG